MDEIYTSISDLFLGDGIIISIACMTFGLFLKGTFKKVPNNLIPFINIVIAIVAGFAIPGTYSDRDVVSKVIILSFLGLSSVGLYESLCIIVKRRFDIDLTEIFSKYGNASAAKTSDSSTVPLDPDIVSEEETEEIVDSIEETNENDPGE